MGVRWLDSTTKETNILPVGRFQSRSKKPKSNCGGAKYWFGDFSHPMLPIFCKDDSYCVRTTVRILPPMAVRPLCESLTNQFTLSALPCSQ